MVSMVFEKKVRQWSQILFQTQIYSTAIVIMIHLLLTLN
jgi:hypothetical protein